METQLLRTDQLIEHEHKMCLYGQPPYIMAYQMVILPEGCEMSFNKGTHLWMEGDEAIISVDKLLGFIKGMIGAIASCDEYLLNIARLQLLPETSQMDTSGQVRFLYLPFDNETCVTEHQVVSRFIQQLQKSSDTNCERSMSIFHGLNIALAEEPFELMAFRQQVKSMLGESL